MECFLAVFDCAVLGFVRTGQSFPKHRPNGWIAGLGLSVLVELWLETFHWNLDRTFTSWNGESDASYSLKNTWEYQRAWKNKKTSVYWGLSLVEHCMQEQFLVKWHEESWLGLPVQSWSLVYLTGTWNHWILVLKGSKIAEIPVKTVNVRAKYTLGLVDPVLGCSAWVEASRDTVVP